MTTLFKLSSILQAIRIKVPPGFFTDIDKLILKFRQIGKGIRTAKTFLKKKETGRITATEVQYTFIVKLEKPRLWYWPRDLYQWNGTENTKIDPDKCSQMTVGKGAKAIQWIVFTINGGAKKKKKLT